jgi:uncharacterized protein YbcI
MDDRAAPTTSRPSLTEISNAAVALHRDHFGRGPGAAKSYVTDDVVVCVLTDIFTPVERTLIDAGESDHVRRTRAIHQVALEETYKQRMAEVIGRPLIAYLSTIHIEPDFAVEIFMLGPGVETDGDGRG